MPLDNQTTGKAVKTRQRLSPEARRCQLSPGALSFSARHGFDASTRVLARELGISQPLLDRYFPPKDALIDSVYEEVFVRRWTREWEEWRADRSQPMADRLK